MCYIRHGEGEIEVKCAAKSRWVSPGWGIPYLDFASPVLICLSNWYGVPLYAFMSYIKQGGFV